MRRLRYLDMERVDLISCTIIAACVIHNVCLMFQDNNLEQYEIEGQQHVQGNDMVQNAEPAERIPADHFRDALAREMQ